MWQMMENTDVFLLLSVSLKKEIRCTAQLSVIYPSFMVLYQAFWSLLNPSVASELLEDLLQGFICHF